MIRDDYIFIRTSFVIFPLFRAYLIDLTLSIYLIVSFKKHLSRYEKLPQTLFVGRLIPLNMDDFFTSRLHDSVKNLM